MKLFSIVLWLGVCSYGTTQSNKLAIKKIDSTFASYNSTTPGVAVAVVKDGQVVFKKGYGMANLEHAVPITTQTVFNIASLSKQFTAFAIYLLEHDGLLSFEDDVRKYIPELPDYGTIIKIKHLLAHTSGLRDHVALTTLAGGYYLADRNTTEQNLKLMSRQQSLNFIPGSTFGYCNSNYTLLAIIVHRVTGKPLSVYSRDRIFLPLGMLNTQFCDDYEVVVKNKAESYELEGNRYHHKPLIESNPGPSNLLTTVEDLCKWVLNFEKPKVGNTQLLNKFNEPSYLDNGNKVVLRITGGDTIFHAKGQNISKDKGGYIGHGGHTAGFRTFLGRYPAHRITIIQLSNDEHNERLGGRWDLADYYINIKAIEKNQVPVARTTIKPTTTPEKKYTVDLNTFVGIYYSEELETKYRVELMDHTLILKHRRLPDISLKRIGETKFSGSGPYVFAFEIDFKKIETGPVIGFDISNYGVRNLKFEKQG